uniref:Uncharacterized protein n=1 Tax=Cacopsylla melanoneura TaxID=428564 RepID=A0A8D8ZWG3_9HEMI
MYAHIAHICHAFFMPLKTNGLLASTLYLPTPLFISLDYPLHSYLRNISLPNLQYLPLPPRIFYFPLPMLLMSFLFLSHFMHRYSYYQLLFVRSLLSPSPFLSTLFHTFLCFPFLLEYINSLLILSAHLLSVYLIFFPLSIFSPIYSLFARR